jgi:hypothetical protein
MMTSASQREEPKAKEPGRFTQLFRVRDIVAAILAAFALIALAIRAGDLDWPVIFTGALDQFHKLVTLIFGTITPTGAPSWVPEAINAYFWVSVAFYSSGYGDWGPGEYKTWPSRCGWKIVEILACALWPISVPVVLVVATFAVWAFAAAMTQIGNVGLAIAALFRSRALAEEELIKEPRFLPLFALVTRYLFAQLAKQCLLIALVLLVLLLFGAALSAATQF